MNTKNIDMMKTFRLFSACAFLLLGATLLVAPMGAQPHRHKATQERQHHNFGMSASPRGHGRYHENGKHDYKRGGRHNGNDGYSRGIARGHDDRYRWHSGYRPRGKYRNHWYSHYRYGWSSPVRPPMRPWRHSVWRYRPSVPVGFRPLASAPIVDGVIGIYFGTLRDNSLNYLYCNNYVIDGYSDDMVYLSNVDLLGYRWPEAMLLYDSMSGLNYAQFSYSLARDDSRRYNRLYRKLCRTYGPPVSVVRGAHPQITWVGGDGRGYVTLSRNYSGNRFFTLLSFGY